MKLDKLAEQLYLELSEQMQEVKEMDNPLERLRSGLFYVQSALAKLKIEIGKSSFPSQQDEIRFFKGWKPKIYAWLIFITEQYAIENSLPLVGKEEQIVHLQSQLFFINRFFRQNEFFYQYFKTGVDDLDEHYFVRGGSKSIIGFSEVPEVDPEFATVGDYLFSKFIGYERLQEYLLSEIELLSMQAGDAPKVRQKELIWTGDSVNIIELVYGIYETRQINDGKASIAELMDFFGQIFQINLSKYFKRFSDIKRRKAMSKTRFLDEMQQLVAKRIEDSDAWIPEDQRARYGY